MKLSLIDCPAPAEWMTRAQAVEYVTAKVIASQAARIAAAIAEVAELRRRAGR